LSLTASPSQYAGSYTSHEFKLNTSRPQNVVVPYKLYELYDWGKAPELYMKLYDAIERSVFDESSAYST